MPGFHEGSDVLRELASVPRGYRTDKGRREEKGLSTITQNASAQPLFEASRSISM